MSGIIDFHSHILPGIDDGSASLEESIAMLRAEAGQGIPAVIATPHFYAHRDNLDRFLERRAEAEQALRREMQRHEGLPRLHLGAEVHYFTGISNSGAVEALTVDGGDCLLVEMPMRPWEDKDYRELERLYTHQGLTPIIAHVERYLHLFRPWCDLKRLQALPVHIQANASFFLDRKQAKTALQLLEKGQLHLLGSDCHNLTDRRPNLGEAVETIRERLGSEALARIRSAQESVFPPL